METSAKEDINVSKAFDFIIEKTIEKVVDMEDNPKLNELGDFKLEKIDLEKEDKEKKS